MEATCFSETSVDFQRTTRRYIPEDKSKFTWSLPNSVEKQDNIIWHNENMHYSRITCSFRLFDLYRQKNVNLYSQGIHTGRYIRQERLTYAWSSSWTFHKFYIWISLKNVAMNLHSQHDTLRMKERNFSQICQNSFNKHQASRFSRDNPFFS
jgi:hypothetical protein